MPNVRNEPRGSGEVPYPTLPSIPLRRFSVLPSATPGSGASEADDSGQYNVRQPWEDIAFQELQGWPDKEGEEFLSSIRTLHQDYESLLQDYETRREEFKGLRKRCQTLEERRIELENSKAGNLLAQIQHLNIDVANLDKDIQEKDTKIANQEAVIAHLESRLEQSCYSINRDNTLMSNIFVCRRSIKLLDPPPFTRTLEPDYNS